MSVIKVDFEEKLVVEREEFEKPPWRIIEERYETSLEQLKSSIE
jgi:hypothetical protein